MKLTAKIVRQKYALALMTFVVAAALAGLLMRHSSFFHRGQSGKSMKTSRVNGEPAIHIPDLQIASVTHHGRIIEVTGSAEHGSVVMINGQPAATLFDNNTFKHFVGPVSAGTNIVTITIQNNQGGVTTRQLLIPVD